MFIHFYVFVVFADTENAARVDRICVDVYIRVNLSGIAAVSFDVFGYVFVYVVKYDPAVIAPFNRRVQKCAVSASVQNNDVARRRKFLYII